MAQKVNNTQTLNTVLTQANAGSAGGTMKYINIGGMKLLWLNSANSTASTTYTVTFPTSFFSATPTVVASIGGSAATTDGFYIVVGSVSSTGFQYYSGTNPQLPTGFLVIGA